MDGAGAAALVDTEDLPAQEIALIERERVGLPRPERQSCRLEEGSASLRDLQIFEDFGVEVRHSEVRVASVIENTGEVKRP